MSEAPADDEHERLREVALQNASVILAARMRAEQELVAAKEALRQSNERLQATFNQAAVGMAVANLDGVFVEVNEKFTKVLGYTRDELRGMSIGDITHPDDRPATRGYLDALLAGATAEKIAEKRYCRKDGDVVWSLTAVNVLRDSQGRPQHFIGVIEDITARKNVEERLREESRDLELLNQTGISLASSLDLQTLVQTVTDAATQLTGASFGSFFYNTTDANGDAFMLFTLSGAPREAFEKFGQPRATALFGSTFRGEGPIRCADVRKDPRYGQWAPHNGMPKGHLPVCSYLAVPVISRSGEVLGGLFFGNPEPDVFTERDERIVVGVAAQAAIAIDNARLYEAAQRAAEERMQLLDSERAARAAAERASAMKDEFLATLSHELRTPLSAILGWSQVLRKGAKNAEDLQRGLDTIERNARAQTQLIEDLLDMSRITSGKLRLDVQQVDPSVFIQAAVETVRPAAEAKGVALDKVLDPAAGPISGDTSRLQQVVWNLLSNAIKFTPKGGKVQVLLERVGSHAEISVTDTGIGIASEFLPRVFDRFTQANATTTRTFGGLGLGLAIVRHLVELHGGTVDVRSRGEGLGATFSVQLPLSAVKRSAKPRGAAQRAEEHEAFADFDYADLSGLKVLVVDDEPDARELIHRVLTECRAEVVIAASADEAVPLVRRERPDVLVSDIGMPNVDGYELLKRVRALGHAAGGGIPAIALTAFARSEDRTRALRAGFLVHVSKPVEPAELVATVASVAGRAGQAISD
jgi:PAS domain S-box-containing protein